MHRLSLVAYPSTLPITADDAALEARCSKTDPRLLTYLKPAVRHIEGMSGRALLLQTWDLWLPAFPRSGGIELPLPPLREVLSITYLDSTGAAVEMDPDTWTYTAPSGEAALAGCVYPASGAYWPTAYTPESAAAGDLAVHLGGFGGSGGAGPMQAPVAIRFTAGYGENATDVPDGLRLACSRRVGQLWDGRQDDTELWDLCGFYCLVRLA
jgi:uncharacterized phiE125 gp8 family phage protein